MTDYATVLTRRYASKEWWISGNDYDTLEWMSDGTKPSKSVLDGLWVEVQAEIADEAATKAASRQAVLDRLGLSADEVQLLLGS